MLPYGILLGLNFREGGVLTKPLVHSLPSVTSSSDLDLSKNHDVATPLGEVFSRYGRENDQEHLMLCRVSQASDFAILLWRSSVILRPVFFSHSEIGIPYSFWTLSLYHSGITLNVQNGTIRSSGVA